MGYQPPNGSNQYDFFLNPQQAPKRSRLSGNKLLQGRGIFVLAGGLLVVLILVLLIGHALNSGNQSPDIAVAQDQNEIARVSSEGWQQAAQQTTLNFAATVNTSLTSSQNQWLAYLKQHGHSVSTSQLNATKNVATDQRLTQAAAISNYDPVFIQVMQSSLQQYINDLKAAYPTVNPQGKQLLQTDYNGAQLLLQQASAASAALST